MGLEASQREPSWGNAERRVHAAAAFMEALGADLRVVDAYERWVHARDLPRLQRRMDATRSHADISACCAAMATPAPQEECRALADLLDRMGLRFEPPAEPFPWTVGALDVLFRTAAHNDVASRIGVPLKRPAVELTGLSDLPPGRRARHECAEVWRDARWVYRHFVRRGPTDSIRKLGREWAEQEQRSADARSVVQKGLDRGVFLLQLANRRTAEM